MSKVSRLSIEQLSQVLERRPDELSDLVLELRRIVQRAAPKASEAIKFNSICYYHDGRPWGAIGGNVCMITIRPDEVQLSFLHGAFLPDPDGVLKGRAKSKRHIAIHSRRDLRNPAIATLIRAASVYRPAGPCDPSAAE